MTYLRHEITGEIDGLDGNFGIQVKPTTGIVGITASELNAAVAAFTASLNSISGVTATATRFEETGTAL